MVIKLTLKSYILILSQITSKIFKYTASKIVLNVILYNQLRSLRLGSSCLVKHSDELWHLANIESIDNEHVCVRFKKFNIVKAVTWAEIYPLDNPQDDESSTSEDYLGCLSKLSSG